MKRLLQLSLVLLITAGLTTIANAQTGSGSADIKATATVDASINVNQVQNLTFGSLAAGDTRDVQAGDADAGQFTVDGNSGNVTLEFSFANNGELQETSGSGASMPIAFDGSDAAWGPDATTQSESWDPTTAKSNVNVAGATNGEIYVFIGGSITAASDQLAGTYEETITLTATHN